LPTQTSTFEKLTSRPHFYKNPSIHKYGPFVDFANEKLFRIADILPPTYGATCPSSPLVVYAERGLFSAEVNWTEPAATDNSGILPTMSSNHKPFERFSQGKHVITYITADQSGNKAICTFTIDVRGKNDTNFVQVIHTHVCI